MRVCETQGIKMSKVKGTIPTVSGKGKFEKKPQPQGGKGKKFEKKKPKNQEEEDKGFDSRFGRARYDPRFLEDDKNEKKVVIDDRFKKMLTDESFAAEHEMDEYGKVIKKNARDILKDYYHLDKDDVPEAEEFEDDLDKEEAEGRFQVEDESEEEGEEGEGEDDEEGEEESEEESGEESEGEYSESSDSGEEVEDVLKRLNANVDEDEPEPERIDADENVELAEGVTSRLAIVNMDWSNVQAVDILAVLHTFAPPGGVVKKVTVYPSDIGVKMMALEATKGPQGIWKDTRKEQNIRGAYQGLDEHKLRKYEKNKMKYYYAIAECDSPRTAAQIYDQCDDMEFLDSSITLDLRYVPDNQVFKNKPRDEATKIPDEYQPPSIFTKAAGHSVQELTWDQSDAKRANLLMGDFSRKGLKDMNYETFVMIDSDEESDGAEEASEEDGEQVDEAEDSENASGSEEEEKPVKASKLPVKGSKMAEVKKTNGTAAKPPVDKKKAKMDKMRSKYQGLLAGLYDSSKPKEDLKISFGDSVYDGPMPAGGDFSTLSDEEDASMDREITFVPGLAEHTKEVMKAKELKEKPVWEQYLTKRAEKQKEIRKSKTQARDDQVAARMEAIASTKSKKKPTEETEAEKKGRAQLELLLAGEQKDESGFDMRQLVKEQKDKETGKKKRKDDKVKADKKEQEDFKFDMADPRFAPVLSSKDYAIDPSHAEFKKTPAMAALVKERIKSRYDESGAVKVKEPSQEPRERSSNDLIASVKRKASQFPVPKAKQLKK